MKPAGWWVAMGFLTRLPVPAVDYNAETVGASLRWYPLVGLLLGGILWGAASGLSALFPDAPYLAATLLVGIWVALTGALHLDGLADTLDAWIGGLGDRERTLAIMKDPHVGASAVVGLCLYLVAKIACVTAVLSSQHHAITLLVIAPLWGRLSPLWLFHTTPYVRAQGLGSPLTGALNPTMLGVITAGVIFFTVFICSMAQALALLMVIAALFALYRYWLLHRLGGTTGDTAGALIEGLEVACLVILLAV